MPAPLLVTDPLVPVMDVIVELEELFTSKVYAPLFTPVALLTFIAPAELVKIELAAKVTGAAYA